MRHVTFIVASVALGAGLISAAPRSTTSLDDMIGGACCNGTRKNANPCAPSGAVPCTSHIYVCTLTPSGDDCWELTENNSYCDNDPDCVDTNDWDCVTIACP